MVRQTQKEKTANWIILSVLCVGVPLCDIVYYFYYFVAPTIFEIGKEKDRRLCKMRLKSFGKEEIEVKIKGRKKCLDLPSLAG